MNWDEYFLSIACVVGQKSKCMSRHIGAVLVRDNRFIIGTGYNGVPIGVKDCSDTEIWEKRFSQAGLPKELHQKFGERLEQCPRRLLGYQSGEGLHICPAAHAERNAIDIAARVGQQTKGCSLYLTCNMVCLECAKTIIQAGINDIVVPSLEPYEKQPITGKQLLREAGILYRQYNCDSKEILAKFGY